MTRGEGRSLGEGHNNKDKDAGTNAKEYFIRSRHSTGHDSTQQASLGRGGWNRQEEQGRCAVTGDCGTSNRIVGELVPEVDRTCCCFLQRIFTEHLLYAIVLETHQGRCNSGARGGLKYLPGKTHPQTGHGNQCWGPAMGRTAVVKSIHSDLRTLPKGHDVTRWLMVAARKPTLE